MKNRIRNPRDFWAGLIFLAVGLATAFIGRNYPMGTASRMGSGYFPFVLAVTLAVVGLIITIRSFASDGPPMRKLALRPLIFISGAIVVFGLIAKIMGIALSIVVLVMASALGGHEFKLREALIAAFVLALFSVGIFVYGLKLPFPIWPQFLGFR